jgi:hypothetical protein
MPFLARFAPGAAPQLICTRWDLRLEKSAMRIANWAFIILLVLPLGFASAQDDSLGAAARRAQDQKKDQPKSTKVWDNDNLPASPGTVNVVGQTPSPNRQPSNTPAGNTASQVVTQQEEPAALTPEAKSAVEAALKSAKAQLDSVKADADILQRKYTLDSQTYYGKTNYAEDTNGAAALKSEKDQVDAKTQGVAAAQKIVDDLQAKLKAAGAQK